jgi:hypothetical protein
MKVEYLHYSASSKLRIMQLFIVIPTEEIRKQLIHVQATITS